MERQTLREGRWLPQESRRDRMGASIFQVHELSAILSSLRDFFTESQRPRVEGKRERS